MEAGLVTNTFIFVNLLNNSQCLAMFGEVGSFMSEFTLHQAFFSPILRLQQQQNFRNLEFRREVLEFSEKSFHFDGGNLEFPLSLEEKS